MVLTCPDPLVTRLRAAGCVWAEDEAAALRTAYPGTRDLEVAVLRREAGEPLEHVLGYADFCGHRVTVAPGVFVPRRRAEPLARLAVEVGRGRGGAVAVDLGCGSGALAVTVARACPDARVLAVDVDPAAVACARANGEALGVEAVEGDWLSALPDALRHRVDILVTYLPHVPSDRLPLLSRDLLRAEGARTVDGGADGLDPLRDVLDQLPDWLAPDGVLVTLVAAAQVEPAVALAEQLGWRVLVAHTDNDALLTLTA